MASAEQPTTVSEVDLLVLGAGPAGMTTALVASIQGLDVLLVEKSGQVGGTAATSAGTIWIPGNTQSTAVGYDDTATAARTYLDGLVGTPDTDGLREAFIATGPVAIDYLTRNSEVRLEPSGKHPDYRQTPGAAVSGRTLTPAIFDGRRLGHDFERIKPPVPEFMVMNGMMVGKADIPRLLGRFRTMGNFAYSARLFVRYLTDRVRHSRGTRLVMGNALVASLFYSLKRRDVAVMFDAHTTDLIDDGGRVVGAVIRTADGTTMRVRSRRGVVLATGGYGHDAALREEFMPRPVPEFSLTSSHVSGDGIGLARRYKGAVRSRGEAAFWTPVSVTRRRDGTTGLFPHLSLDRAKPGLIAVNAAARRFVNEADSYHDFVLGMYRPADAPAIPAYLICEASFVREYGLGQIHPGTSNLSPFVEQGYIQIAPTLRELAVSLSLDGQDLVATIARYNEMARMGRDLDFGKGESELNRFNGDPAKPGNPCMAEIREGPFVGIAVWPAEIGTSAGIAVDADGRVLTAAGLPILGLYACGNDMASMMEGTYPGPGTTLGPALTFGYRVAMHAAGNA